MVKVTETFVEEIVRASARHATSILDLTARVDRQTAAAPALQQGVAFTVQAAPQPVEILVGDVVKRPNPRSGKDVSMMAEAVVPVRMKEFGTFATTRSLAMPRGWIIPKAALDTFTLGPAIETLRRHGIRMRTVTTPVDMAVEQFAIESLTRAERSFQGRRAITLAGAYASSRQRIETGSIVIDASQPLARLAFYLVEPESDDGFVTWNVIDEGLAAGLTFPIWRMMGEP